MKVFSVENLERAASLAREIQQLGFNVLFEPVDTNVLNVGNPPNVGLEPANNVGSKISKYFTSVRAVAKSNGISFAEAKKLYKNGGKEILKKGFMPENRHFARVLDAQEKREISNRQKSYWRKVRKYAKTNGIAVMTARQAIKDAE